MKKLIRIFAAAALFLVFSTVTAFAWFYEVYRFEPEVSGSAITGYFAGGTGEPDDPYELSEPIHVYNLAWLQYMGYLNEKGEGGKIKQLYFEIIEPEKEEGEVQDGKIDMSGIILPPIGTTAHPFVGHFNGNGYCISNLTVSNYLDGENDELKIVERPLSVTDISDAQVSIVGFFGVVGDINGTLVGKLAEDGNEVDIKNKVNSVHDLFLENLTIRTETAESLVGLVAGYANGSIVNVGVAGESELQLGSQFEDGVTVKNLSDEEIFDMQYVASAFSLIGKYNADNIVWEDIPIPDDGLVDDDDQDGLGWGGSINMINIKKRIMYIVGAAGLNELTWNRYEVNALGYHALFTNDQAYQLDYAYRNNRAIFLTGTVMPLSIDPSIYDEETVTANTGFDTKPTYQQLIAQGANKEPALSTNSGYLVGGGTEYNDEWIKYLPEYPLGYGDVWNGYGVYKSFKDTHQPRQPFPAYDSTFVMHMLTVGTDGKTYVIRDEENARQVALGYNTYFSKNASNYSFADYNSSTLNLKRYIMIDSETGVDSGVKTKFINGHIGETLIQGIAFNSKINISNNLANLKTMTTDVTLLGEKSNYEMIEGAINFSLKEEGITTTVLGTYRTDKDDVTYDASTGKTSQGLYTIFEVKRNANNEITDVVMIETIHERLSPGSGEDRYVYNLPDNQVTNQYKLVYDREKMSTLTEGWALYYFEIPLNAGDYAMGATVDDDYGACLLYLDIGANGDKTTGDDGEGGDTAPESMHTIAGVTFVPGYSYTDKVIENLGEDETLSDRYTVITFELKLTDTSNDHSGLSVKYERTQTQMNWTETDTSGAFTVTPLKDKDDPTNLSPPG